MDSIIILTLFAMFSLTLITLSIFGRPETAMIMVKAMEKLFLTCLGSNSNKS